MKELFKGKVWSDITRDERYFCAELFQIIKENQAPLIYLLNRKYQSSNINSKTFDIGYEVCFYRDYIKEFGYQENYNIKTIDDLNIKSGNIIINKFPQKRTFDLCLFSDDIFIIIEAKAQQGFANDQLKYFDHDKLLVKELTGNEDIEVAVVGLYSSKYTPRGKTLDHFDYTITWKDIFEAYSEKYAVLKRADSIYK
jgi:hypothetical protein